jgi:hypothetical protein
MLYNLLCNDQMEFEEDEVCCKRKSTFGETEEDMILILFGIG